MRLEFSTERNVRDGDEIVRGVERHGNQRPPPNPQDARRGKKEVTATHYTGLLNTTSTMLAYTYIIAYFVPFCQWHISPLEIGPFAL